MNCISRRDHKDKKLFLQGNKNIRRWNLYSQIGIENDKLICANEIHNLTELCLVDNNVESKFCTLKQTNEIVDIIFDTDK